MNDELNDLAIATLKRFGVPFGAGHVAALVRARTPAPAPIPAGATMQPYSGGGGGCAYSGEPARGNNGLGGIGRGGGGIAAPLGVGGGGPADNLVRPVAWYRPPQE